MTRGFAALAFAGCAFVGVRMEDSKIARRRQDRRPLCVKRDALASPRPLGTGWILSALLSHFSFGSFCGTHTPTW